MVRILTIVAASIIIIAYLFIVMKPKNEGSGKALIGGDFSLTSTSGGVVSNDSLKGRPRLVYFGFTYCPDICPAGLLTISAALKELGEKAPAAVFITVDPERDTVEQLRSYMEHFPGVVGLTGSIEQVKQAAKAYRVYYQKVENEQTSDYLVNHTGYIYLMDADGAYITHFDHAISVDELVKKIRAQI